jgi:copper resistance protein B
MNGRSGLKHIAIALVVIRILSSSAPAIAQQPTKPGWPQPVHNDLPYGYTIFNQNELRLRNGNHSWRWDSENWYGHNINRVALKTEGFLDTDSGRFDDAEAQVLYSRAISPFFNLQAGGRYDFSAPSRGWAVIGVEGLAPLFWEVGAFAFIGSEGRLGARLEGNYDLLLTQRLILQPQFEINASSKDDLQTGIGSGLSDLDCGLRLRYEIKRQVAPYIGVTYSKMYGQTATLASLAGRSTEEFKFTLGMRIWL